MRLSRNINRKMIIAGLSAIFMIFAITMIHKVYADKLTISLNSPVSFPIDI